MTVRQHGVNAAHFLSLCTAGKRVEIRPEALYPRRNIMEGGIKLTKHPCFVFAVGQTQIGFPGKMVVDTGFSDTNLFSVSA